MAKKTRILKPDIERILTNMGYQIKKARLRRNIRAEEVAEQAGISKGTLTAVEKGVPTVSIGAYAAVLHVLGMENDLEVIAMDEAGKKKYQRSFGLQRERAAKHKGYNLKEKTKMGVWMIGTGSISIKPQVKEDLIKEYIKFSKSCFPEEYGEESFPNTWFFDEDNKLFSIAVKFAEPSIWYCHIKENFFEPRGYELEGEMIILGEGETGYREACVESKEKYRKWKRRMNCYGV